MVNLLCCYRHSGLVMYFSTLPAPSPSAPCILAILTHLRVRVKICILTHPLFWVLKKTYRTAKATTRMNYTFLTSSSSTEKEIFPFCRVCNQKRIKKKGNWSKTGCADTIGHTLGVQKAQKRENNVIF